MISPISAAGSGASPIDFAAHLQQLRALHFNRKTETANPSAPLSQDTLKIEDLDAHELADLQRAGAHGFARRYALTGSRYVQRIWWG